MQAEQDQKCCPGGGKHPDSIGSAGLTDDAGVGFPNEKGGNIDNHYTKRLCFHYVGVDGEVLKIVADEVGHDVHAINHRGIIQQHYPS